MFNNRYIEYPQPINGRKTDFSKVVPAASSEEEEEEKKLMLAGE